jgi:hypothetical protein
MLLLLLLLLRGAGQGETLRQCTAGGSACLAKGGHDDLDHGKPTGDRTAECGATH